MNRITENRRGYRLVAICFLIFKNRIILPPFIATPMGAHHLSHCTPISQRREIGLFQTISGKHPESPQEKIDRKPFLAFELDILKVDVAVMCRYLQSRFHELSNRTRGLLSRYSRLPCYGTIDFQFSLPKKRIRSRSGRKPSDKIHDCIGTLSPVNMLVPVPALLFSTAFNRSSAPLKDSRSWRSSYTSSGSISVSS